MNTERFVERILETENLTDELEDDLAQRLLDWGIARLPALLAGIEDVEAGGARVNALMALMRSINRMAPGIPGADPVRLANELGRLDELARALYPQALPREPQALLDTALALSALDRGTGFDFLLGWPPEGPGPNIT